MQVLLDAANTCKVSDFGMSSVVGGEVTDYCESRCTDFTLAVAPTACLLLLLDDGVCMTFF